MSDDRDEVGIMDWTTPEYLSNLAAEELGHALSIRGIGFNTCFGDEDGLINLGLHDIKSAEALMVLAIPGPTAPGTLYDRATGSCVKLAALAEQYGGDNVPEELLDAAFADGWVWMIHPDMKSHVPGWHVTVTLPMADANTVTARLNALPFTDDTQ